MHQLDSYVWIGIVYGYRGLLGFLGAPTGFFLGGIGIVWGSTGFLGAQIGLFFKFGFYGVPEVS